MPDQGPGIRDSRLQTVCLARVSKSGEEADMLQLTVLGLMSALLAQDAPRTDGWVVLPIEQYRELRSRAFPVPPEPPAPPLDAALTRVDYELRLTGDTISGQARLTVDVLKQGWASVQVPAGILVRDARLDGRPTALVEGTPPRVLISRPGRSILTLDVVVPLTAGAGTESIALPPSGSALSSVTLLVPRTGVALSVTGGFIAEQSETGSGSRWVVYGNPGRPLTFNWKRRSDDRRSALPLRTRARITELVALGEDATQINASIQLEVTQGQARDLTIALPADLIVNQVSGPAVADWNVDRTRLSVTFLEPITTQTSVVIGAELKAPREGSIAVPLVRVPAAERETGGVAIDVVGAGEIARRDPHGLEPADPSDLGDIVAGHESPSMVAFKFSPLPGAGARSLTLDLTRYASKAVLVANVEEARYDALLGEDGKVLVRARYAVRNNQRSFLAVALPAQSTLWSAALEGRPIRPGVGPNGGVLLPLKKGRSSEEAPSFVVELVYLQRAESWIERGDARVALPALDLPVSRTGLTLHHSPRYAIELRPGSFRLDTDTGPWTAVLHASGDAPASSPPPPGNEGARSGELKMLVDRLEKESGRTRPGVVPIAIPFPAIGPSVFLAAELTPEMQAPSLDVQYRRTGGR
jgi:Cu/Zn superoxide dismutase